jgi:hypothetical protein
MSDFFQYLKIQQLFDSVNERQISLLHQLNYYV